MGKNGMFLDIEPKDWNDALGDKEEEPQLHGLSLDDEVVNKFAQEIGKTIPNWPDDVKFFMSFSEYMLGFMGEELIGTNVVVLDNNLKNMQEMFETERRGILNWQVNVEDANFLKLFQFDDNIENMPFLNLGLTHAQMVYMIAFYLYESTSVCRNVYDERGNQVDLASDLDFFKILITRLFGISFDGKNYQLNIQRMGIKEDIIIRFLEVFPQITETIVTYKDKSGNSLLNSIIHDRNFKKQVTMKFFTLDSLRALIESKEYSDDELTDIILSTKINAELLIEEDYMLNFPNLKTLIKKRLETYKKLRNPDYKLTHENLIEIPEDMRVGTELEYYGAPETSCGGFNTHFDKTVTTFGNWTGIEAVSPILTSKTINNVLAVADLIKEAGGKTDASCGLHVHIDSKYFNVYDDSGNIDEEATIIVWKNFLMMWAVCERMIYSIVNKAGTISRDLQFSRPISHHIKQFFLDIEKETIEYQDSDTLKWELKEYFSNLGNNYDSTGDADRYFAVNFSNLFRDDSDVEKEKDHTAKGTVEFRLATGTLESDEIALTMQLFTSFMEMSRELGLIEVKLKRGENITDREWKKWCTRCEILGCDYISRNERFSRMLDLLFGNNNRDKYEERYEKNKNDNVILNFFDEEPDCEMDEVLFAEEYNSYIERGNPNPEYRFKPDEFKDLAVTTVKQMPGMIENVLKNLSLLKDRMSGLFK